MIKSKKFGVLETVRIDGVCELSALCNYFTKLKKIIILQYLEKLYYKI